MDADIVVRGIERLTIDLGGILFAYMGYRLFIKGVMTGGDKLSVKSKLGELVLSGKGPGLFFMAFGAGILITSLFQHIDIKTTTTSVAGVENKNTVYAPVTFPNTNVPVARADNADPASAPITLADGQRDAASTPLPSAVPQPEVPTVRKMESREVYYDYQPGLRKLMGH